MFNDRSDIGKIGSCSSRYFLQHFNTVTSKGTEDGCRMLMCFGYNFTDMQRKRQISITKMSKSRTDFTKVLPTFRTQHLLTDMLNCRQQQCVDATHILSNRWSIQVNWWKCSILIKPYWAGDSILLKHKWWKIWVAIILSIILLATHVREIGL